MRTYLLIKLTGWTLDEIDNAPAELCDWLLGIDATFEEVHREARAREREQMMGGRR